MFRSIQKIQQIEDNGKYHKNIKNKEHSKLENTLKNSNCENISKLNLREPAKIYNEIEPY